MTVELIFFSNMLLSCYEYQQVVYGPLPVNIREVDTGSYLLFDSCRICPISMNVLSLSWVPDLLGHSQIGVQIAVDSGR